MSSLSSEPGHLLGQGGNRLPVSSEPHNRQAMPFSLPQVPERKLKKWSVHIYSRRLNCKPAKRKFKKGPFHTPSWHPSPYDRNPETPVSNVNCEALDLVVVVEGHQTTRCAALGTWRPSTRPKPTSSRQPWYPGPQGGHVSAAQHQGCVQGRGRWLSSAATRATSLTQSPETPRGEEEAEQRVISLTTGRMP